MALCSLCSVNTETPPSQEVSLRSNPIRVRRWRQASGIFNSPRNDITASWSTVMITHSTNLGPRHHTHTHAHCTKAWAKHVHACGFVVEWPYFGSKGNLSALLPQGLCPFWLSWQCSNKNGVTVTKDPMQRLFLYRKYCNGGLTLECTL